MKLLLVITLSVFPVWAEEVEDIETAEDGDSHKGNFYVNPITDEQKNILDNWHEEMGEYAWIYGNQMEGDMIMPFMMSRYGLRNTNNHWPNGRVIYKLSPSIGFAQRNGIMEAMRIIEESTCVRFLERSTQAAYVYINNAEEGCYSTVGYYRRSQTEMNLQPNACGNVFTIIHEFLHTLGFFHEHMGPDRDDHIEVIDENVMDGLNFAFDKETWTSVDNFGVPYNLSSVMHYPSWAFSKNGLPTIVAKNSEVAKDMGQRRYVADTDWLKVNRMYKCL